ncbi:uncharacterized protein LOC127250233 isoform X2 [Andrographis paniculata]|uniref:uncharacterized protein LOC127250233 isoform X2 n=1 Tax=Andrographis paniculata TaxID=175694 RepID=UPI0021E99815|nr:uncharacterized protein LOC127250233 isoform X2 [Andrographis paniculata]
MRLLNPPSLSRFPPQICSPSHLVQRSIPFYIYPDLVAFPHKGFTNGSFRIVKEKSIFSQKGTIPGRFSKKPNPVISAAANRGSVDVPFPTDYTQLLQQAREATQSALKDNKQLMEIEFPTAGLESVPGDGEGGIEMTGSMQMLREFCDLAITQEKATKTRIFLPEANEVEFARRSAFVGSSLKLDYLTKPSLFEDFGFGTKVKMAERVKPGDELFLVGYPYFNVNEMLVVEELYKEAVENTLRKLIIFNGELDRIRSGYYPPFFYPKLAALSETFLPKIETIYYIHNFKGRNAGVLFRENKL